MAISDTTMDVIYQAMRGLQARQKVNADNIANIQSSWVTQGLKVGQLALFFGANDMGSLMIEENVVASAGTVYYLSLDQIKNAIREAGYIPRQRNVLYQYVDQVEAQGVEKGLQARCR